MKNSKRIGMAWLFLSIVLLLTSFVIKTSIVTETPLPLIWKHMPLESSFFHEIGNCYITHHGKDYLSSHELPSHARLLENGISLGIGNTLHDDIRNLGKGRFSIWHGDIYFSSSDNSNPALNGRRYEIFAPIENIKYIFYSTFLSWFGLVIFSVFVLRDSLRRIYRWFFQAKKLFIISCLLVLIAYLIPRLPFFIDYPLPAIQLDTHSYFQPVQQIFSGVWPNFDMRTPGYPLFLSAAFLISDKLMFVIILQNLLTLISVFFFLWVIYKTFPSLIFFTALVMIAHVALPMLVGHDLALMTESLYTSCLLFSLGFFILAIQTDKPYLFFLSSAFAGYAIFTRPAGIFLFIFLILTTLYLIINRYSVKSILCQFIPVPAMILMLMLYNLFTVNHFTISSLGPLTMYAITSPYWETDKRFPDEVNAGIKQFKKEIRDEDKYILYTSWNPDRLYEPFHSYGGKALYLFKGVPHEIIKKNNCALAKCISHKAILSHPEMYAKWCWTMLYSFLIDNASWNTHFYSHIDMMYKQMYMQENILRDKFMFREYMNLPELPTFKIEGQGEDKHLIIIPTMLYYIDMGFSNLLKKIFDRRLWLFAYLAIVLYSFYVMIRWKFKHSGAFILFAISSIHLSAGIIIALFGNVNRYPYPTKFTMYLAIAFIPLLFKPQLFLNNKKRLTNKN